MMKDSNNYQKKILKSLNADFYDDQLNINAILDYYYNFLPQIKVFSNISGKYTLYSTRKKIFTNWLVVNKNKIKEALQNRDKLEGLYEIFFKPIKYKNVKFFLGSHNSNKGQWLICNESEKDVEVICFSETNEGMRLVKEVLKSKQSREYIQKSLIRLNDGSIISLHYKIDHMFKSLVDSFYYIDNKGELLLSQRNYSLKNWASFCNQSKIINPYNHFTMLEDLEFYDSDINNKSFTFCILFKGIIEFISLNKNSPVEIKIYQDLIFFIIEQLFNDIFTSRNSTFTSVRRPVRNDFKLFLGFDITRVGDQDITQEIFEKINKFIYQVNEYIEYTKGKKINLAYTNKYFRKLIKAIKKVKIKGKNLFSLSISLSALNKEQKKFKTPYNLILDLGRGPNIEAIPNTASMAICNMIIEDNLTSDNNIFIDKNTIDILKPAKKIYRIKSVSDDKSFGPTANTQINYVEFKDNII